MIDPIPPTSLRIERIRRRYQTSDPWISIQRAKHYTASWTKTA